MRFIKNQLGIQIPLASINHGVLTTDMEFQDYGLKVGESYKIHNSSDSGPCFFGSDGAGETRLLNNELTDAVLPHLMITI